MLHSTLALSLLLIAVSSNLAMAIKKEKRAPQTLSRGILCSYILTLPYMLLKAYMCLLRCDSSAFSHTQSSASFSSLSFHSMGLLLRIWPKASDSLANLYQSSDLLESNNLNWVSGTWLLSKNSQWKVFFHTPVNRQLEMVTYSYWSTIS